MNSKLKGPGPEQGRPAKATTRSWSSVLPAPWETWKVKGICAERRDFEWCLPLLRGEGRLLSVVLFVELLKSGIVRSRERSGREE